MCLLDNKATSGGSHSGSRRTAAQAVLANSPAACDGVIITMEVNPAALVLLCVKINETLLTVKYLRKEALELQALIALVKRVVEPDAARPGSSSGGGNQQQKPDAAVSSKAITECLLALNKEMGSCEALAQRMIHAKHVTMFFRANPLVSEVQSAMDRLMNRLLLYGMALSNQRHDEVQVGLSRLQISVATGTDKVLKVLESHPIGIVEGVPIELGQQQQQSPTSAAGTANAAAAEKAVLLELFAREGPLAGTADLQVGAAARVLELLAQGTSPNVSDDKEHWTPLMGAVFFGRLTLVTALLAKGAKTEAKDAAGRTALIIACSSGSSKRPVTAAVECIRELLKAGADKDAVDNVSHHVVAVEGPSVVIRPSDPALLPAFARRLLTVTDGNWLEF